MLKRYNAILDAIKDICPTAHIGGGAVRDSLLERPIRDIDLFLDDSVTDRAAKLMRSQFGFVKVGELTSYEQFSDPAVVRLAKFEKADETIPVCPVGLKMPRGMQDNLRRFDFGICMAAWDGKEVYTALEREDLHAVPGRQPTAIRLLGVALSQIDGGSICGMEVVHT